MEESAGTYSFTLPMDPAARTCGSGGPLRPSPSVAAAVRRRSERDRLSELIAAAEAEHGPISDEAVEEKREIVLREQTGTPGTP